MIAPILDATIAGGGVVGGLILGTLVGLRGAKKERAEISERWNKEVAAYQYERDLYQKQNNELAEARSIEPCGCHTIYLTLRGSGIDSESLKRAKENPGYILPLDDIDAIRPMVFHTCGKSRLNPSPDVSVEEKA